MKIFVFLIFCGFVGCEVFSSTDGMIKLIKNQEEFLDGLKELVKDLQEEVEILDG